jgi:two-component system, NarL family, nitrate/nitrite response regulator NarL
MPALDLALLVHLRLERETLSQVLAASGHTLVAACQHRNELFARLETTPAHVVLVDVDPALSAAFPSSGESPPQQEDSLTDLGLDAVKALRTWYPQIRVLALATRPESTAVERIHQSGAHGLLDKDAAGLQLLNDALDALSVGARFFPLAALSRPTTLMGELPFRPGALTDREIEVLRYIAVGADNLKIATLLQVSERTVRAHVSALYRKLSAKNRVALAIHAGRMGLKTPTL